MENPHETIKIFNESIDRWIGSLEKYDFARLILQPDPESWSVGQLCNHLIEETGYYFQQCRECLAYRINAAGRKNEEGEKIFRMNAFPDERIIGPATADSIAQPAEKEILLEGMKSLKEEVNTLGEVILKGESGGKTKHPGLGWFGAGDWFRFAQMHFRHHFRQKERIDRFLENIIKK